MLHSKSTCWVAHQIFFLGSTRSGKEQYLALALVGSMTRKLWAGPDPPGRDGIRERIYSGGAFRAWRLT